MMRKFLVELQFDGRKYSGFQKNGNARTIQAMVEIALKKLFEKDIDIVGSSRTDAGVSAREFCFVFCADTKLPANRVAYKLNRFLPKDIQCQNSEEVDINFDLRKAIESKTYQYVIYNSNHIRPLIDKNSLFVGDVLDYDYMKICANKLVGTHNYKSFCNVNADTTSFVRTVENIKIDCEGDQIKMYFTAQNFLYNMVRILAGTLVECGKHKLSAEDIDRLFMAKDRSKNIAKTLPAKALTLYGVKLKKIVNYQ